MGDKILFKFTLPYPWKKTLHGIYWITIGAYLLIIILAYNSFIFRENPPDYGWFLFSLFSIGGIALGLALIMRYILIHGDKIKAPIEVWVDKSYVHFRKGRIKFDFLMEGLKTVRVVLNDKMVMLETNYEKDEDWKKGWKVAFKRKNEFNSNEEYVRFVKNEWKKLVKVVTERIKALNPGVEVIVNDKRKKYK